MSPIRAIAFLLLLYPSTTLLVADASNILFIAIDDLRPDLGCYGDSIVISPNIDALAASGRLFRRAYCQQAVCNPSRTSLMTGLRPDTIGVTGNHIHFRSNRPDVVTLSKHFKNHGYHAQSIGKIYHGVFPKGTSKTKWDTMGDPVSWSVPTTRFGPRYYYTESGIAQAKESFLKMYRPKDPGPNDWTQKLVFGPMTEAPDVSDETLFDGKVATKAVETIASLAKADQPFFLAVGFIKPHSPFVAPKKYWDLYDPNKIPIASQTTLPEAAPKIAGHRSGEIRRYTDQPNRGEIPASNQRRMKHGYYACISYVDAQLGKVMDALKSNGLAENTIVVLFGDHGYHLGEHGLWGKTTNFELDTRVPLIVRVPGMKQPGTTTRSIAELVDLYPTLSDLAGLPIADDLEGKSLTPVLVDPSARPSEIAISQFPRGKMMGYSLRTDRWRYTEWIDSDSGDAVAAELYDHQNDDSAEVENLAERNTQLVSQLSGQLRDETGRGADAQRNSTGFEDLPAGPFTALDDPIGRWTSMKGNAAISKTHRRTGVQCLHILGGFDRSVEVALTNVQSDATLSFHAERWTKRSPFKFRIEQSDDGKDWHEIYNGDKQVRIGGFLTKVSIPLKGKPKRLRFTATSPSRAGIMIDDLALMPPVPQQIVSVTVDDVELPVLVGVDQNPLLRIRVDTIGSLDPISVTGVKASVTGSVTDQDVADVQLFASGDLMRRRNSAEPFGEATSGIGQHQYPGKHTLEHGANLLWLSCSLKDKANIDRVIKAACLSVSFSDDSTYEPTNNKLVHRLGTAVRQSRQGGIHTSRIPGLATTNDGTLIAVYDLRYRSGGDLPGDIDVGMSRSIDGGQTWERSRVIMDMGNEKKMAI